MERFLSLNQFEISEKSDLFNFSKLSSFLKDKKLVLLKEARQLKWEFKQLMRKLSHHQIMV